MPARSAVARGSAWSHPLQVGGAQSHATPRQSCSKFVCEHVLVVPIPITLQALLRVVFVLEAEELDELRITGLHLLSGGPTMVRQEVAAAVLDGPVDDPPKILDRFFLPCL